MATNIVSTFLETAARLGPKTGFKRRAKTGWQSISWEEAAVQVKEISLGLKSLGVGKGDRVAILSSTRIEWGLADLAIMGLGAITVPIYPSNLADQVEHITLDSGAKAIFAEDKSQLDKLATFFSKLPENFRIILIDGKPSSSKVITLAQLEEEGRPFPFSDFESAAAKIKSTDEATFVYTSGTTGNPKGAILNHEAINAEVDALAVLIKFSPETMSLIFLPLAHILARVVQFFQFKVGFVHAYSKGIEHLGDDMREIRPHFMASVPRVFEKVYSAIIAQVEHGSALKRGIFGWAMDTGRTISGYKKRRKDIPLWLKPAGWLADLLVFRKIRAKLGGRLNLFIAGGAPLGQQLAEFFHAVGILILEGYGLTETTAATNLNRPEQFKFGTVGPAVPGVEEKIAPDGEILVRGPVVFSGYYKNPDATREVLDGDGWFHTGDIGEIDKDGFLKITDRKKDIIVTAGGKNIAPQNIEGMLKTMRGISQAMVHGDRRKFLSALITINKDEVEKICKERGIVTNGGLLSKNPKIYNLIKESIDLCNKKLPSYESIKKFAILDEDFTQENGELTPTLKVKRKLVTQKYQDVLDSFYKEV